MMEYMLTNREKNAYERRWRGGECAVVVRVRPLSEKEIECGFREITTVNTVNNTILVENPHAADGEPPKTFTFDTVFDTDSRQMDVYNETARPIVDKVLMGYNGTILAYGQTGTGKTFTMQGECSHQN
ncbi:hypothetical protein L9F63_028328 [Diploptera punctata]|uniref:Kinesin motor domain-containing protein n=1 Tax=Diploptera punctata TaxID=6984 RepID=A0AAD7ZVT9_DIPPU|nr:hypothetical protein L9F63_028328 [Diploptera punctata]